MNVLPFLIRDAKSCISRVNLQFNPQQIATKGFQRIWVVFDIISNILKVPQNPPSRKLLFLKWRPRWPP